MRLRQLKLAGFKSFVDPIIVPFPSQLVAVVGPNGCGKSNIIDAVRWVMGESHAKNLRGESIVDVIFKGSSNRKSVGQASVELVFDNNMGRLTGPYSSYQEIAVKRIVTRDGESSYFLNGTRCRRRDITDIFLGTGAGARGYSIIGQDTISKIIEARPEELRAFLEEAAGVSKYKERRRETFHLIANTRENLARVADIQSELLKQLTRLERQAQAAIQYKEFKQSEHQCRIQMLILKWRTVTEEFEKSRMECASLTHNLETHQIEIQAALDKANVLQEELGKQRELNQTISTQTYKLATEIALLKESILQNERDKQQLYLDTQQLNADLEKAQHQLQSDIDALHNAKDCVQQLNSDVHKWQILLTKDEDRKRDIQQKEQVLNAKWQDIQTSINQAERDKSLSEINLQHIDQRHQQLQLSLEKNQQKQAEIDIDGLLNQLIVHQAKRDDLYKECNLITEQYKHLTELCANLRHDLANVEQDLRHSQDKVQPLAIECKALTNAHQTALQKAVCQIPVFDNHSRVIDKMTVDDSWEGIVDCILKENLHAIVLDSMDDLLRVLPEIKGMNAVFTKVSKSTNAPHQYPKLSDKISGINPCGLIDMDSIFTADSLEQALIWLPTLSPNQSVITKDGYWLSLEWARVLDLKPVDEIGLLSQKKSLDKLNIALKKEYEYIDNLTMRRDKLHAELLVNEKEQSLKQEQMLISQRDLNANDMHIQKSKQSHDDAISRLEGLVNEHDDLMVDLSTNAEQRLEIEIKHKLALEIYQKSNINKEALRFDKLVLEEELSEVKKIWNVTNSKLQSIKMQEAQALSTVRHVEEQIERATQQINRLREHLERLDKRHNELSEPEIERQELLSTKVDEHQKLEQALNAGQQQADTIQKNLQEIELSYSQEELIVKQLQSTLLQAQLQEQTADTKAISFVELLDELDINWRSLTSSIPTDITVKECEQSLLIFDDKIKRLGAINLLAIEEYQTDLERKEHLDNEYQDLSEALITLERAIAKMDKETEVRLRDTFDQVNSTFKELFPRLFGGGHASLELTCDNLLEAGILVMAQPPGKKNNTIYMLSGGEKAMTAVALVFAIFKLNPSPFCMLDEVDAPLDDANVRRFCELVKDMSQFVQFLFITHNKVTMELAEHLIGVTMREPGVSRIVSVDIAMAIAIAID